MANTIEIHAPVGALVAGPAGAFTRRPFSYAAAVFEAVREGEGDNWTNCLPWPHSQRAQVDERRDDVRFHWMRTLRETHEEFNLRSYVQYVLPLVTERKP